jgi:hypothetical protein
MKMIKVTENHFVVIDDTPDPKDEYYYNSNSNRICQLPHDWDYSALPESRNKKIMYSTKPFETLKGKVYFEDDDFDYIQIKPIDLSYVKSLIGSEQKQTEWDCYFDENGNLKLK